MAPEGKGEGRGEETKKKAWWEEDKPIDWDALLVEDSVDKQQQRRDQVLEAKKKAWDKRRAETKEESEVLEKFYGIKPPTPPDEAQDSEESKPEDLDEIWNFPEDKDKWDEAALGEIWADPPPYTALTGFDPKTSSHEFEEDETRKSKSKKGTSKDVKERKPDHPTEVYVPYRQTLPTIPFDDNFIDNAKDVLEEMAMEEEHLDWGSYVFKDGSTYEGTVFNDLAQGKGVYTTPQELCRYEGEWMQNMMSGHGVLTVDVPAVALPPDTKFPDGKPIPMEFEDELLTEEDKEWMKKEFKDLVRDSVDNSNPGLGELEEELGDKEEYDDSEGIIDLEYLKEKRREAGFAEDEEEEEINLFGEGGTKYGEVVGDASVTGYPFDTDPFEDHPSWEQVYGELPEDGQYRYAGQMKHNRMHGCGVFTVNRRMHYGKFYFGDFLLYEDECDAQTSAFHAAMAEVVANKARMFTFKPDGMVREARGPYTDPSHPYMYHEDDVWMAPGFINQFHKVPEFWENYVEELDKERELWLNSFHLAPLRNPMPAELEYLWDKESEFVVLSNELSELGALDPNNFKLAKSGELSEVLLHVPSKQIINWTDDADGNLRFFIQPFTKDGKVDPSQAIPLPTGFDKFMNEGLEQAEELEEDEEEEEAELELENEEGIPKTKEQIETEKTIKKLKERVKLLRQWKKEDKEREAKDKRKMDEILAKYKAENDDEELEWNITLEEWKKEDQLERALFLMKEQEALEEAARIVEEAKSDKKDEEDEEEEEKEEEVEGKVEVEDEKKVEIAAKQEVKPLVESASPIQIEETKGEEKEEEEEDEDEEEDDKKPRSFGTVAMVSDRERCSKGNPFSKESFPHPTVFASITLSTQVLFHQMLKSAQGIFMPESKNKNTKQQHHLKEAYTSNHGSSATLKADFLKINNYNPLQMPALSISSAKSVVPKSTHSRSTIKSQKRTILKHNKAGLPTEPRKTVNGHGREEISDHLFHPLLSLSFPLR